MPPNTGRRKCIHSMIPDISINIAGLLSVAIVKRHVHDVYFMSVSLIIQLLGDTTEYEGSSQETLHYTSLRPTRTLSSSRVSAQLPVIVFELKANLKHNY
jgi:hypothetical protein